MTRARVAARPPRYRHIEQGAARFASAVYQAPQRYLTGDSRLGRLREDQVGAELALRVLGGGLARSGLDLSAAYDHSWFHFIARGQRVEANVLSLSLGAIY